MMTWYSEKMIISYSCIRGFMPNSHKKSWMVSTLHVAAAQQPVVEGVGEFLIVPQAHFGPHGLSQKCCRSCCSFWVSATVGEKGYIFSFQNFFNITYHELRTLPREEIAFTARPKIHSHSQIFRYSQSIFCLPHRPNFSDIIGFP